MVLAIQYRDLAQTTKCNFGGVLVRVSLKEISAHGILAFSIGITMVLATFTLNSVEINLQLTILQFGLLCLCRGYADEDDITSPPTIVHFQRRGKAHCGVGRDQVLRYWTKLNRGIRRGRYCSRLSEMWAVMSSVKYTTGHLVRNGKLVQAGFRIWEWARSVLNSV